MSRKDELIGLLQADLAGMADAVLESERIIEGLALESDDRAKELARVHEVVKDVIDDMRNLQEVPAGDLFQSIGEIVGALRAVIV